MSDVHAQYEAYPYPARDPKDEAKRLITGSPSEPREMDHILWGGQRDWRIPLRALFAGGGTGDGLIQLAQFLTTVGRPYEITYVDLSEASREIAQARAKARGLKGITFHTGSLLDAQQFGEFDYIDCCGVLHHLPDPSAGFRALRGVLAQGGGLGFMVYAPYGRSGVYPLQEAFGALLQGLAPDERLARGREIFEKLPKGHAFKNNPHLGDHKQSDAGFYDLLLHTQDRAFDVGALLAHLDEADWELAGFCEPAAYDLARYAEVPAGMSDVQQMGVAEKLNGTMKVHVGYARAKGAEVPKAGTSRIPHLRDIPAAKLAQAVSKGKSLPITRGGERLQLTLPKAAAPLIAGVNGRRTLAQIASRAGFDPIAFAAAWQPVERDLTGWGVMRYSNLLKGIA